MKIYPVQKRTRYLADISFSVTFSAAAAPFGVTVVTAAAGVHCGNKHEARRKGAFSGGSYYGKLPVLKRLSETFKKP